MPHRTPISVRFYELDPYNHLNHAVYVQYFEVARIALLESVGFGLDRLERDGYRIVVTELTIKYLESAGPRADLVVETEIIDMRRASSRWQQRMLRDDVLMASQQIAAATIGLDGSVVRFPENLAEALAPYLA